MYAFTLETKNATYAATYFDLPGRVLPLDRAATTMAGARRGEIERNQPIQLERRFEGLGR